MGFSFLETIHTQLPSSTHFYWFFLDEFDKSSYIILSMLSIIFCRFYIQNRGVLE